VALFARPLPERVILPLLRMPLDQADDLRRWTRALTHVIGNPQASDADIVTMLEARAQMTTFFAAHLDAVRAAPGDDLVTALIEATDDNGRTLTEGERVGLLINFLVAGNETSIKATTSAIRMLAQHPDVWRALQQDRTKVPNFLEEALRLEPPTQGMFRYLADDLVVGDLHLPAGRDVYVNFAAANRDADAFPAPDEIDLARPHPMRHLAFGQGPHTCLGAWLARLEITNGIEALLDHVEAIRLAPGNRFDYDPSFLLHGLVRLDVEVDASPAVRARA
jgi:cytochrome P450